MFSYSGRLFSSNRRAGLSVAATIITLLFSFTNSSAQSTPGVSWTGMVGNEEITGKVFFPPADQNAARPLVKLRNSSSQELTGVVDRDGKFRFIHLRPDQYTVVVDGGDAYQTAYEMVTIGNAGPVPAQGNPFDYAIPFVYEVQIYLKPKRNGVANQPEAKRAALADIAAPARALFEKALESEQAGNRTKAIELLQSAVAQAPKFTVAYNELGVQFLKGGHADKAAEAFKAALAVTPSDFTLLLNYGIALLNQKMFAEAETQLSLAIQKNAASPLAYYYQGLALVAERKYQPAQTAFESAIRNGGEKLALAHKYLGGVYWKNNDNKRAADELEKYVTLAPQAPDVQKVRESIKELRSGTKHRDG